MVIAVLYLKSLKKEKIMCQLYPSADLSEDDIEELSYLAMRLLSEKSSSFIKSIYFLEASNEIFEITGILNAHIRYCRDDDCQCKSIQFIEENSEHDVNEKEINEKQNIGTYKESLEQSAYEILISTIKNFRTKINAAERELIIAYVNFHMQDRMITALYNLMLAEDAGMSMIQQFHIYCLRYGGSFLF